MGRLCVFFEPTFHSSVAVTYTASHGAACWNDLESIDGATIDTNSTFATDPFELSDDRVERWVRGVRAELGVEPKILINAMARDGMEVVVWVDQTLLLVANFGGGEPLLDLVREMWATATQSVSLESSRRALKNIGRYLMDLN